MSVKRLGKGLGALIRPEGEQREKSPAKRKEIKNKGIEISLKSIKPNPNQPRREFDDFALE